jgi:hypothetical protein
VPTPSAFVSRRRRGCSRSPSCARQRRRRRDEARRRPRCDLSPGTGRAVVEVAPGTVVQLSAATRAGLGPSACGRGDGRLLQPRLSAASPSPTTVPRLGARCGCPYDRAFRERRDERAPAAWAGRAGADAECTARARAAAAYRRPPSWPLLGDGTPQPRACADWVRGDDATPVATSGRRARRRPDDPAHRSCRAGPSPCPKGAKVWSPISCPDPCATRRRTIAFDFDLQTGHRRLWPGRRDRCQLWDHHRHDGCGEPARLYCVQKNRPGGRPTGARPARARHAAGPSTHYVAPPVTRRLPARRRPPGAGRRPATPLR